MSSVNEIRSAFVEFFAARGHEVVASAPLVPQNDPTLMFINAGMVPFKNVFTGAETRPYNRAVSSQKCVRAGGKHNDLDNVGYTARHHTFFEMLGNFSFGDYFKDQAIEMAWQLITGEYQVSPDRLSVTVYHDDDEAFDLWRKISGLPEQRIIRIATSDNFWAMGDTGPCGPCSEIFYDHGDHIPGGPPGSPDEDGDRFVEIWNLVFMQYDQQTPDQRIDLPRPSIDTGMGLERIAAVLQGTHDNFETDLFRALINASSDASGVAADGEHAVSHRVIADHLRACSFLISDGVLPSNEGRGYVLRRIMRRAMRHAQLLGCKDPLMWRLVPALVAQMGSVYGELNRAEALITETLRMEEVRFKQTLERGLRLLEDEVAKLGGGKTLPGEIAFRLYDTYGFPLDLTQDALRTQGREVDIAGFEDAMAAQRAEARAAWSGSGDQATESLWFDIREQTGATEFLGYTGLTAEGRIEAIVVDGETTDEVGPADRNGDDRLVSVIFNQTPFYGESGGQAGDVGSFTTDDGVLFTVAETQKKLGDLMVLVGTVSGGALKVGDNAEMTVDRAQRSSSAANHSATHLLHAVLRSVLGEHVTQKGSAVTSERLRFDFSHPKALTDDEISRIEREVNRMVRDNAPVTTRVMTPDDAVEAGALALFGEKYGDEVRVVSMGSDDIGNLSTELCGGTHVLRTGDIGTFHITGEAAVASGVRRIEAMTGAAALEYLLGQEQSLRNAAAMLKAAPADLEERLNNLVDERKTLKRELADAKKALAIAGVKGGGGDSSGAENNADGLSPRTVGAVQLIAARLDGVPPKDLRGMVDEAKAKLGSGIVAYVAVNEGKAAVVVGATDDLTDSFNSVDLVQAAAAVLGGKGGGGRADMAQAGGPDGDKAEEALAAIEEMLAG